MGSELEERIAAQLTTLNELVKHLATKEELQSSQVELHKLRVEMILWIIGTNVAVGGALAGSIIFWVNSRFDQLTLLLQHWKP
jgi:hypothetical protein